MKKRVVVFGAGSAAVKCFDEINAKNEIVCFVEIDKNKIGTKFKGYEIYPLQKITELEYDEIILCIFIDVAFFYSKLEEFGINKDVINDSYSLNFMKPRITFLKNFSDIVYKNNIKGSVAEAGVFRGEFAQHINKFFPDRKLFLYDTFDGFDKKDINNDEKFVENQFKHFANTSIDIVMNKMTYPQNCVIKKGYFPNTAKEDDEIFCFVSLDMDLYEPIKNGLEYFYPKMSMGGIILIDDYFSDTFLGSRKAVDEFCKKYNLCVAPIGYELGVIIIKN